ncbi:MAG: alpha/beta fold hydrolase [Anaerolineae bacterium]|nr:alpha/beta fold hydrolase [Anaerolineae bacterium]
MQFREQMEVWPSLKPYAKNVVLEHSKVRLHAIDAGPPQAPGLLLVHGLGDESDTWRHIIPALAVHQRVIAPDLPGFGRSEAVQNYSIPGIITVLLDLIDTLHVSTATLLGSSLGGILCHTIAIQHPHRVRGLVLLDGHLAAKKQKLSLESLLLMLPGIGEWRYAHYQKNAQAAYESLRPFYADLDALPEADRKFLYRRVNKRVWSHKQRTAYLSVLRNTAIWMIAQQHRLNKALENLDTPTVVIYGGQDNIMHPDNACMLNEYQKNVQVMILPGVGHLPQQEAPDQLLSVLDQAVQLQIEL